MEIHNLAKAADTIGWFLGDWSKAQPLLEEIMHKNGITGMGFFMHDGWFFKIRFETVRP